MPGVRHIQVAIESEGQRLDNFLLRELKGLPKTRVYRLLRRGEVRVNGGRARPEYRVCRGDRLRLPPMRLGERELRGEPSPRVLERIGQAILFEDEQLLILDKPSGLAVHGGSGLAYGAIEAIRARRPELPCLDLAHRLDRDTSGCLILAKRRDTLRQLHALMRSGGVEKRYLALLKGELGEGAWRVEAPLERCPGKRHLHSVRVSMAGRQALSVFRSIERYAGWALADVELHTGRMHQIRVHAACSGHPVAGDERYGDRAANRALRRLGLRRLFLHASRIAFELPGRGEVVAQAALSDDLSAILQALRERMAAAEGAR
ncbi:MAG: RluA family pseudouridine synthase [Nitrococcus sp.]|nr:RluA family pseudouridine synthase [Nitrococcus sp.]